MNLPERISLLGELSNFIKNKPAVLEDAINQSSLYNKFFTDTFIRLSLDQIQENYLDTQKIERWISQYPVEPEKFNNQSLGIVMAGNIPLVGFHDFLCGILAGYNMQIKLSSKDKFLLPVLTDFLFQQAPELKDKIHFIERIEKTDSIIATGDDNTHRYFEYYFRNYKHLLRKNRNSVAVLTGNETPEQIAALAEDVFNYFGLGCRSVSSLYVPENYDFSLLFESWKDYAKMMEHHGYKNNYDYHTSILLLSKKKHLTSGFLTIYENEHLASPMSCLHYQYWKDEADLLKKLNEQEAQLQCVVGEKPEQLPKVPFGKTQFPALDDYADNCDTMAFLTNKALL